MKYIQKGSTGSRVKEIQQALVNGGWLANTPSAVDGKFGSGTEAAVIKLQTEQDLFVDGKVGDATLVALGIKDEDTLIDWGLKHTTMVQGARELGVSLAFIQAVAEVESSGSGFHKNGLIKTLYERHIFHRRCMHYGLDYLAIAARLAYPDLCDKTTGGYVGGVSENKRIERAKRLNRDIALESASYGRFQIMGFHWERLGFTSVDDFVETQDISEDHQFQSFLKFIQTDNRLLKAAREEDCLQFALIYNGAGQKGYDVKIRNALQRFKALGTITP